MTTNGVNGLMNWARSKVFYVAVLIIFSIGALAGWFVATQRHACEQLADRQARTEAILGLLARTTQQDGARNTTLVLQIFAEQAAKERPVSC